LNIVKVSWCA